MLATIAWVHDTWYAEVAPVAADKSAASLERLVQVARRHAAYCRDRDISGVMTMLRVEFAGREHPIGDAVRAETAAIVEAIRQLIIAGRHAGEIPDGPPASALALAVEAAVESGVMALAGRPAHDQEVAERIVRGIVTPA